MALKKPFRAKEEQEQRYEESSVSRGQSPCERRSEAGGEGSDQNERTLLAVLKQLISPRRQWEAM